MAVLEQEIDTYNTMQSTLEANHLGEWIVIHDRTVAGFYADFEQAAAEAVEKFGRGPYLIREVGARPMMLPTSVMYGLA